MSGYKTFAVAGAGTLGKFIISELLKEKAAGKIDKVVVLTRSADNSFGDAEALVVDYSSPEFLQSALKGVEVLVCTLGTTALAFQEPLAEAAKAAGVKLFIPSDFAGYPVGKSEGLYPIKNSYRDMLDRVGLPWTTFATGPFGDWIFYEPMFGYDLKNGTAEVGGTGDGLVSFTARPDIARFVAHILTTVPASELPRKIFQMEGERISVNGVITGYEKATGKKIDVTRVPMDVVHANLAKGDFKAFLQFVFETAGTTGPAEDMNVDWPDFHPMSVVESLLANKD
ncbi:NADP-binding protein [Dacryopinax primogenitus]|uniref:NADP-binding protein n=1 Tax=Dacryopinax primogenitus (strain DJM 731) TaxID=1858805 RepID=M5FVS9_DACPD|nr:NADP-binding protein [Dacryopinax primogenitus]EJU01946.1 NADP-binding protein [Dacryopinax primogenitus]